MTSVRALEGQTPDIDGTQVVLKIAELPLKPIKLVAGRVHRVYVERSRRHKQNLEVLAAGQADTSLSGEEKRLLEQVVRLDDGEELHVHSTRLARFLMGQNKSLALKIQKHTLARLAEMNQAMKQHAWQHKGAITKTLLRGSLQTTLPVRDFDSQLNIVYRKFFLKFLGRSSALTYAQLDWDTVPRAFLELPDAWPAERTPPGKTPVLWKKWDQTEPLARLQAIMQWSSMPGTSRHHWGSDVDIINTENLAWQAAPYQEVAAWLDQRGRDFGFRSPYGGARNRDSFQLYGDEPWHLTSFGLARYLLQLYRINVRVGEVPPDDTQIPKHGMSLRETIYTAFKQRLGDEKAYRQKRALEHWPGGSVDFWQAFKRALNNLPLAQWVFNIDPSVLGGVLL